MQVLESMGQVILKSPEKLKFYLCPVLVKGRAEQERFYELFDRYWEEVQRPWEMPVVESAAKTHFPDWLKWALLVVLVGSLVWVVIKLIEKNPPPLKVYFDHQPTVAIGDTIHFNNQSEIQDSSALQWEVIDTATGETERLDTESFDLDFVVENAGRNQDRVVRLSYLHSTDPKTGKPITHTSTFHIRCNNPPVVDLQWPEGGEIKTATSFDAKLQDAKNVKITWDFGDSTATSQGAKVTHQYRKSGQYKVTFTAVRDSLDGDCTLTEIRYISIGRDKAYLNEKFMVFDNERTVVRPSWVYWSLLGLLGLAMIWYWVKWISRKPPPIEDEKPDLTAALERYKAVDKGPYFIPFRPQEGYVRMEPTFYRLADVLRQRQEGLRKNMDVPASLKKTIDEGGFPNLLSKVDAVPTEYLFLIDEQTPGSHQSKLYTFLVDFLRKREVLGDSFYFKTEPIRFWNSQYPEGITPDQLVRLFPYHRLIVLGDGHGLLDPHPPLNRNVPSLRPDADAFFRHWKHRLLLTPMPVVSWTYREGTLHRLFAIFPSDTEGLGEAIKFVERGMDGEDLPVFSSWCERLLEGRRETDLNYRRWRNATDHRDYLRHYPLLYRWVCALAVYPKPDWNISLAIGRALNPLGLELTFDRLLIISRIPWLVTGDLSPRLRKELLADLDSEAEHLAREAVQTELQAVEALVVGSHANQERQINLALQNFAIAPDSPETQASVRDLLDINLLTARHLSDLNQSVERHFNKQDKGFDEINQMSQSMEQFQSKMTFSTPQVPDIQQFLEENKPPTPLQSKKPFFTKEFWLASGATFLVLIFILTTFVQFSSSMTVNEKGNLVNQNIDCQEEYVYGYLYIKECMSDSSVLYNNAGVKAYTDYIETVNDSLPSAEFGKAASWFSAEQNFKKAIKYKPDYQLAPTNLGKMYFNSGKLVYDTRLKGLDFTTAGPYNPNILWDAALPPLRNALAYDSVRIDALNAIGLVHFYAERKDSAESYYNAILKSNGKLYFDTLQAPNLKTLLFPVNNATSQSFKVTVVDERTNKPLKDVLVVSKNFKGFTDIYGSLDIVEPKGERAQLTLSKNGYAILKIIPKPSSLSLTFYMKPTEDRDSDKDNVPDSRDKCPKEPGDPKNAGCPIGKQSEPISLPAHMPVFKNCENSNKEKEENCTKDKILAFIKNRLKYPSVALKKSIEGTVVVQFIIERDGSISNVKSLNDIGGGCAEEAVRLIKSLPKFKPGLNIKGEAIRVSLKQQIQFTLDLQDINEFHEPEMVFVKGGTFRMGCDEKRDGDCTPDEQPVHDVTLSDFSIGKYEVTNEEYAVFLNEYGLTKVKDGPNKGQIMIGEDEWGIAFHLQGDITNAYYESQKGYEKYPVVMVTWYGVIAYTEWLSEKTGKQYRLPTEAEWEFAARGGILSKFTKYSGSNNLEEVAWYKSNSNERTHSVGAKAKNELGIFDMSGNVWEWCSDFYDKDYYQDFIKNVANNPKGPATGFSLILRGGNMENNPATLRCADRGVHGGPGFGSFNTGFRLVRDEYRASGK